LKRKEKPDRYPNRNSAYRYHRGRTLKSPELTGEWESKLRKIEKGEYEANLFKEELIQMVTELTEKVVYGKGKVITLQEEEKEEVKEKKKENLPRKRTSVLGRNKVSEM
jgi:DNA topoisomerase-3